jgi:hypothetical protein
MVESSLPMLKLPFHREFLGQAWTKEDKKEKAPNICLITERFNDVGLFLRIWDFVQFSICRCVA